MRRLLLWLTALAVLLCGAWLGGETLMVRQLRRFAAQDAGLRVATLDEMRRPGRLGVRATGVEVALPAGHLDLPTADLWLNPLRPTELRLALPAQVGIDAGAGPMALGLADAQARLRLRPLAGAEVGGLVLHAGAMTLDGAVLAQGLDVTATLSDKSAGAYDITLMLRGLDSRALGLPLPDATDLTARGRLWLDRIPSPQTLEPGTQPLPTGLRIDDSALRIGRLDARILGELHADAQGRAEGQIAVYTRDARSFLDTAAETGLIPKKVVALAGTLLTNISALPMQEGGDMAFPDPAADELRLPLRMAEGKISLGPLTLGPAPLFPQAAP